MTKIATYTFRATCPYGFESALAAELKSFGLSHVQTQVGFVAFEGSLRSGYRAMIRSHLASRILVVLARLSAVSAEALYRDARALDWRMHLGDQTSFALHVSGTNTELRNTSFTALKIKDAIHDQYREEGYAPPLLRADAPLMLVAQVRAKTVTLMVDLVGDPLIFRSYDHDQQHRVSADLYALMLQVGGWYRLVRREHPVLICPNITHPILAVEAARQIIHNAPGLSRNVWAAQAWEPARADDNVSYYAELDEADAELAASEERQGSVIVAIDPSRMQMAHDMARCSGVSHLITFVPHELTSEDVRHVDQQDGLVIFDQTYASLMTHQAAEQLVHTPEYQASHLMHLVPQFVSVVLSLGAGDAHGALELRRGKERMTLMRYTSLASQCGLPDGSLPHRELSDDEKTDDEGARSLTMASLPMLECEGHPSIPLFMPSSEQFAYRLIKRSKHLAKWARRERITCYRLYDADLPDYNVAIDLYTQEKSERRAVQIFEYAPPKEIDESVARARLIDAARITAALLEIDPSDVYIKRRQRAKGGSQYAAVGSSADYKPYLVHHDGAMVVTEHGRRYVVNHTDYLDTGLFLDTRSVRDEIERHAQGVRFLNLFAYTGSATVAAVRGGARQSVTVDISSTYLNWAQQNLKLNRLQSNAHRFERADVLEWIKTCRHSTRRFDLIYVDPPTFSNSARMKRSKFSVQADHVELLINVSRLLAASGLAIFVTNDRGFDPDVTELKRAGVELTDVSEKFLPVDFERNRKIHRTFFVRRIVS